MATTANTTKTTTAAPKAPRTRKSATSKVTAAQPQEAAREASTPVKPRLTVALLAQHASESRDVADLCKRMGIADGEQTRRYLTHMGQGRRPEALGLSSEEYRARFLVDGDAAVYVEPKPNRKAPAATPDLTAALEASVKQVATQKITSSGLSKTAKAKALVAEGLAANLKEARQQLTDLGE